MGSKEVYPELLARNVNSWFQKTPANRMVRTMDGAARAFLSDSHRRIDHLQVAQAALPLPDEVGRMQCYYTYS